MKTPFSIILSTLACAAVVSAFGQPGGPRPGRGMGAPMGPRLGGATAKLFGDVSAFSATMEMQSQQGGETMSMPGKIAFDQGKSRFEMDMTKAKGGGMDARGAAQMKSMGMDKMIVISRPDKKVSYQIYPGLQAYIETPLQDQEAATAAAPEDFKVEATNEGQETVDGHPCLKKKVVVTDKTGKKSEATTWNATDLKNFPVKIQQQEGNATMLFKDVKLAKPEASQFEPPSDATRYDSMMMMMQQVMMKRMGGMGGPGGPTRLPQNQ